MPNKHMLRLGLTTFMACMGLTVGAFGPAMSASALSPTPGESTAFVTNKVAVGSPNAELSPAADPIKACGPSPSDKDPSGWGRFFKVNSVNIRRSPSTSSKICAQGQKSHSVDYHCWEIGSDGYTWTYLRDATTHYAGWVRDNLLVGDGSLVHC